MKNFILMTLATGLISSVTQANVSLSETCQAAIDQYSTTLIAQLRTAQNVRDYDGILIDRAPISECGQTQDMISIIGPQIGPRPEINTAIDDYMFKKGYAVEIVAIRSALQSKHR